VRRKRRNSDKRRPNIVGVYEKILVIRNYAIII